VIPPLGFLSPRPARSVVGQLGSVSSVRSETRFLRRNRVSSSGSVFRNPTVPTFPAPVLQTFAEALFHGAGVPADEAKRTSQSLIEANLCGHDSHGLIRIPQYLEAIADGRLRAGAPFTVVKETAAVLVVDGGRGLGQVQAHRLLDRLTPRAQALGLAAG